ncbi:MAG: hypothetical protein AAGA54_05355 [Myxococcota bacterium]
MKPWFLGLLMAVSGCIQFDTFACADEDDCVLNGLGGQCEASGYCSFPDPGCDSGFRYSEHAPSDLSRACVDASAGSSGGMSTGAESTGGGGTVDPTLSTETEGDDATTTTGDPLDCVDLDEDGAGVGPDCAMQDCDDDNPATFDGCVYVGPAGADTNAGTRDAPWRTFGHAIAQLSAGSSLVVLDGRYVESEVGTPFVDCDEGGGPSGTADMPIFMRAENSRQAVIDREGRAYGLGVRDCSWWRFRGFSVVSGDNAKDETGAWRSGVWIGGGDEIIMRDVFAHHANRYYNEHLWFIGGSTNVLIEDAEAHDFFRSGYSIYNTTGLTCRRCYANSHEVPDLPACPDLPDCADPDDSSLTGTVDCPKCSAGSSERGDNSFYVEYSNDILLENCVSERSHRGYQILGGLLDGVRSGRNIRVVQSISLGDDRGFVMQGNQDDVPSESALLEDVLVASSVFTGIDIRDPDDLTLRNVSVLGAGDVGIRVADVDATACTDGACSMTIERTLVEGSGSEGFAFVDVPSTWSMTASNAHGNAGADYDYPDIGGDPFNDAGGSASGNISEGATLIGTSPGECMVYVPADSNMSDPFGDGTPVGANVRSLSIDGMPTTDRLWSTSGDFPCGTDPLEPAQIAGEQCGDLQLRLNLAEGCEPPSSD